VNRITCRVWWVNEYGKMHAYRAFVTRRENGGDCALYLTYVKKFNWSAPSRGAREDSSKVPTLSVGEPWVDHQDIVLEGLRYVECHHSDPNGFTYYRSADRTLIYVEHVTEN
jgi:hypothetical protein